MRRLFHAAFSIRPDEFPLVQAFFALFAMVGVSITIGATAADTLFLSRYTAAEAETLLPLVYVGIGFVGVLTASLYGRMRERLPRQMSLVGTLLALAASLVLFRQALVWGGKPSFFALVIWIEVCTVLSITLVFSHSGDSFAGRDAKRLYGYISGGLAVGTIVSGYAVEPVVDRLGAEGLLYVAAASLVVAAGLGVLTFRLRRSPGGEEDDAEGDGEAESVPLRVLFSNRFLRYTFGLSLAGLLCACFTDYQLKITASRSMDEAALAVFFGKYYAWLGVAGLVIQFLLVGAILRRLGLSNALLIPPALLFLTCIGFVAWPVVLAAAATEFVRESFSGTLETPSKELLYLPLSTRLRLRAQAFSGGVLEAGGQAVAGLLIVGVMLVVPSIRWLGLFTLAGAATWLFLARALRRQYETVLGESLRAGHGAVDMRALLGRPEAEGVLAGMLEEGAQPGTATRAAAALELLAGRPLPPRLAAAVGVLSRSGGEAVAARAVALLGESRDAAQLPVLRAAARDERPRVRAAAVLAICQVAEEKAVDEVGLDAMSATFGVMSREVHEAALVGCLRHGGAPGQDIARPRLAALVQSADADDREEAARVLGRVGGRSLAAELFPLLTDPHPSVRDAALRAAREVADPVLLPVLCELLSYASTFRAARAALEAMPRGSVRALSERALDSGRPPAVRAALAQALSSVGGPDAAAPLFTLTGTGEPTPLRLAAARALRELSLREGRLPDSLDVEGRVQELLGTLELLNRAARECAAGRPAVSALLVDHARIHAQILFALLGLRFPAEPLLRAEENLFSEDARLQSNALELVDSVLPRTLSARLSPQLAALTSDPASPGPDFTAGTRAALDATGSPWIRAVAGFGEAAA